MPDSNTPTLKRALTLPTLVFYGLGTILGAGIYVLIGEVAAASALQAPLAFIVAGILAALTAFSYAELSARLPFSAGESAYVGHAFNRRWLSATTGYLVIAIGVTSSATIAHGFVGYLGLFIHWPAWLTISLIVLALGAVAGWGISESAGIAVALTVLEIAGLLIVIIANGASLSQLPAALPDMLSIGWSEAVAILAGAYLAFFAFIGFEDMVNVAEEVIEPERNMPRAIILALILSTSLYLLIALLAVLSLPLEQLQGNAAPLAEMLRHSAPQWVPVIGVISLVAVINGALIQMIMASRVLYGMAHQGLSWRRFARVHPVTRTPLLATATCCLLVWALAMGFALVALAKITSFITLAMFSLINLSLWRIKSRNAQPAGIINVPVVIPAVGALLTLMLMIFQVTAVVNH